jgi:hypothetical protein
MHYSSQKVSKLEIQAAERKVLSLLDWNLSIKTPLYLINFLSYIEETLQCTSTKKSDLKKIYKCASSIAEVAIKENVMLNYKNSLISSSCIMAARKINNATPLWPKYLVELTKNTEAALLDLCSILYKLYTGSVFPKNKQLAKSKVVEKENSISVPKHFTSKPNFVECQNRVLFNKDLNKEKPASSMDSRFPNIKPSSVKSTKMLCKTIMVKDIVDSKPPIYRNLHTSMKSIPSKKINLTSENTNI